MKAVRTRFAPSPTGFMHVGNVRSALFPWLIARQDGGQFILRIEDTDQAREVDGAIAVIHDTLNWLGITWDEGPDVDGPYGPYTQSKRAEVYHRWAQKLVDAGAAYADPYSPEEVDNFRRQAQATKKPFLYRDYRPENPPVWDGTKPLRFKVTNPKSYSWHDAVMGDLSAGPEALDDFIIIKSDGMPTYNFAHIVDDFEMKITHVIRGIEYISSVPKYLALYEALNITPPILAHIPHIMAPDGKKKLSKRDGAKGILDYRADGFLPEAMLNFLASMGWNDGTEQEIFSREELIQKFSLDRVQRSGARFDEQRLLWMNGQWIRSLSLDDLFERSRDFWPAEAAAYDDSYKRAVLGLVQERLKFLGELPKLTGFFFSDLPIDASLISGHKQLKKFEAGELRDLLEASRSELAGSDFSVTDLTNRLNALLTLTHTKPAVMFSLIRIATTQAPASPGLAETLAIIGKDRSLSRLDAQLKVLA